MTTDNTEARCYHSIPMSQDCLWCGRESPDEVAAETQNSSVDEEGKSEMRAKAPSHSESVVSKDSLENADHAPRFLKLWICVHCLSPRLYGSRTDCHVCGHLMHDTAEYRRVDSRPEQPSPSDVLANPDRGTRARSENKTSESSSSSSPDTTGGKTIRAHVEGCTKALSVPVDLCPCGGRDFAPDTAELPEKIWIDCYGWYLSPDETSPPNNGREFARVHPRSAESTAKIAEIEEAVRVVSTRQGTFNLLSNSVAWLEFLVREVKHLPRSKDEVVAGEGPSSTEYENWLATRPELPARFDDHSLLHSGRNLRILRKTIISRLHSKGH